MKVLLVEDDPDIASFVSRGLREAGYGVEVYLDGNIGMQRAMSGLYDIVILDLMLPGKDGMTILSEMRQGDIHTPVLIVSARRSVDDRVKGLKAGGDDYLVKPFVFAELLVRVEALIRRGGRAVAAQELRVADLTLDPLTRRVTRSGENIELQPREYALLEFLMRNADAVVTKTLILERVWGYDFDPQTNVVDVLVSRLRSRIDKDFPTKLIRTVRGVGYALDNPQ
ncbi:MAG: DNA-binding response regulator [spirochete symbiont of Stewartia floridana]|nr:MAG: DNA-binding response regulator [spirochete symbiont of Stewartia floridana]